MAKIVCVLYDDPVDGYPKSYARDDIPKITKYPDGQTAPTPSAIDFKPGQLLGSVSGELGLRKFLEAAGDDRDGRHRLRSYRSPGGHGARSYRRRSDLLQLEQRRRARSHADAVARAQLYPVLQLGHQRWMEHCRLCFAFLRYRRYAGGTVAAGRIGLRVLRLLKPFDVHLHYLDRHRLPESVEKELNLTHHTSLESLTRICDAVTLNCPLHPETEHMINDKSLKNFKRGAYLVNTARGKLCDRDAIARALESGQLAGYAGDVWFPQPAPQDHPWRTMPYHGMTPHISGTSLSAQTRYAAGVREILECYFANKPIRNEYLVVQDGKLAGVAAHSYSAGNATGGSEEAAKFKK